MTWSREADLKAQLQRLWDRGEILAEVLAERSSFPRRLVFKTPSASEMSSRFDEVRRWIGDLRSLKNCRIEFREVNHRQLGKNEVPVEFWIDTVNDALTWLGKRGSFKSFVEVVSLTRAEQPLLLEWLQSNSGQALEYATVWPHLLSVVSWMQRNPRPDIYIREVDLPGIDSKFIEQNKHILSELFDVCLPSSAIDDTVSGVSQFAQRYGFKFEREKIRFRILDASAALFGIEGDQDIAVDVDTFANLRLAVKRVFITENKTNFLAFPSVSDSMVIFGAGYGWDALARAHWLFHCDMHYWGDIDTHGFAILNQLRTAFPHVRSLLMDESTARQFAHLAVEETKPTDSSFDHLTAAESSLLSLLRDRFLSPNFRLEQERIDWTYARQQIESAAACDAASESRCAPVEVHSADISVYLRPSRCDRRMLLMQSDTPLDPRSDLHILLSQLLAEHRTVALSSIDSVTDLSHIEDPTARFAATLEAISSNAPAIGAPLLAVSTRIAGMPVTIHAAADLLLLPSAAVNFRLARRVSDHPEITYELSLFSWAFQQLTGVPLSSLSIRNRQDSPIAISPDIANSFRTVAEILRAQSGPVERSTPVGWTKCAGCSFRSCCWSQAVASDDVALLPDVEQELARALHRASINSIPTLLERFDSASFADFPFRSGSKSAHVGKRADSILLSARALMTGTAVWSDNVVPIPTSPTVAVIDLEGLPPPMVPEEYVYLWGLQLFGDHPTAYLHSIAPSTQPQDDREAWQTFLSLCESALQAEPSIQFLHYHRYEQTMIRKYIDCHGDAAGVAAQVLARCVDLHAMLRQSVILPVFSYALKEVESYLGFKRTQSDFGGDWSIATYLRHLAGTPGQLEALLRYNSEDIASTAFIFDWLRRTAPEPAVQSIFLAGE